MVDRGVASVLWEVSRDVPLVFWDVAQVPLDDC